MTMPDHSDAEIVLGIRRWLVDHPRIDARLHERELAALDALIGVDARLTAAVEERDEAISALPQAIRRERARAERAEASLTDTAERERALREALEFYSDPDTYFAISFMDDPPSGEFMDDFSESSEWAAYDRPMPGRRARAALAAAASPAAEGR